MAEATTVALDAFYERLRRQLEHEDNLYNQRLVWLITIESFLYATIGLVLPTKVGGSSQVDWRVDGFILLVCAMGFLVALISSRIMASASRAMDELEKAWDTQVGMFGLSDSQLSLYPHVTGLAGRTARFLSGGTIPVLFALSWLVVAVIMLLGKPAG